MGAVHAKNWEENKMIREYALTWAKLTKKTLPYKRKAWAKQASIFEEDTPGCNVLRNDILAKMLYIKQKGGCDVKGSK